MHTENRYNSWFLFFHVLLTPYNSLDHNTMLRGINIIFIHLYIYTHIYILAEGPGVARGKKEELQFVIT